MTYSGFIFDVILYFLCGYICLSQLFFLAQKMHHNHLQYYLFKSSNSFMLCKIDIDLILKFLKFLCASYIWYVNFLFFFYFYFLFFLFLDMFNLSKSSYQHHQSLWKNYQWEFLLLKIMPLLYFALFLYILRFFYNSTFNFHREYSFSRGWMFIIRFFIALLTLVLTLRSV